MKRDSDAAFTPGPSSIALPSPPAEALSPASGSADPATPGPSRKRARSDVTPEERKEARAHRNRIAAQNSRDRRKAQFSLLEQKVAELEEENRKLRAGMSLTELARSVEPSHEQRERELAREKENVELREKIKTLENGWEAVMKALAASGLPFSLPTSAPHPPSTSSPSPSSDSASQPPTTTFPVIIPATPIFPISPAPTSPSLSSHVDFDETDSTRHLARVANTDAPLLSSSPLQLELSPSTPYSTPSNLSVNSETSPTSEEIAMEDLLREILAPSPTLPSASLPAGRPAGESTPQSQVTSSVASSPLMNVTPGEPVDWEGEVEMQRLLDMLPLVQSDNESNDADVTAAVDFPSALELELCGWDMGQFTQPTSNSVVGAF